MVNHRKPLTKVKRTSNQYPLHCVTYACAEFEVATSSGIGENIFKRRYISTTFHVDLRVKVTRHVAQCPLHHATFAFAKFEVAT